PRDTLEADTGSARARKRRTVWQPVRDQRGGRLRPLRRLDTTEAEKRRPRTPSAEPTAEPPRGRSPACAPDRTGARTRGRRTIGPSTRDRAAGSVFADARPRVAPRSR